MPVSQSPPKPARRPVTPAGPSAAQAARSVAEVNDLTWTGQPEAAIAQATAVLAAGGLSAEHQAELLAALGE